MKSLFFRNLVFTILQPGVVVGVVPFLVAREEWHSIAFSASFRVFAAVGLFMAGLILLLMSITQFGTEGKGTLSPLDPTRKLVVSGAYRFSRNPMYVAVMLMLVSEAWITQSATLWIYAASIWACFHIFILVHEEPRLTNDFGEAYNQYRRKVRRWI